MNKLGEFGLIDRIRKTIKTDASVLKGIGDDCAVIRYDRRTCMLLTQDMLVEGVDFTRRDDPRLVGRKALAVSISDIAACAGLPRYALVSMGIPRAAAAAYIDEVYRGMRALAREYGINIVGGDISRAPVLTIDVSLTGFVEKKRLVLRGGARPGDMIFVSGRLGGTRQGKHLRFTPRVAEARFLAEQYRLHAMIDISDGLAQDLGHIARASNTGAVLFEKLIPFSAQARGLDDALSGGEDFELLFTVSARDGRMIIKRSPSRFFPVGTITEKRYGLKIIDGNGGERVLRISGYRHF
ncbi:MAG: thiamine-phosphate kinase [Candidatus Omnitrophica bacterium]|nr:thiamine-phosphate kinase [Candidatus Omnitrophota bacterium]